MLSSFLDAHRGELIARARRRVLGRNSPAPTDVEVNVGLPVFLDQLQAALERAAIDDPVDHEEIQHRASHHGLLLFQQGLTVAQVVHDYGDLCQVITGLAQELHASIGADEFQTLNLCLDDAIAHAVTAFETQKERTMAAEGAERLGVLAHEMRNLLNTAILSFASIKKGVVAPGGATSAIHDRSLQGLLNLVNRSLADVRLDAGMENRERLAIADVVKEVEIGATMFAQSKGLYLVVGSVGDDVVVDVDRQSLAAAIANLVQNAFKFTQPGTTVTLRVSATDTRVLVAIDDACGGLAEGSEQLLLRPFVQQGRDRTGLGLGLSICVKAVASMKGELRIDNRPGHGCTFTIDLPRSSKAA
jgi:signal transduction histidine kinase